MTAVGSKYRRAAMMAGVLQVSDDWEILGSTLNGSCESYWRQAAIDLRVGAESSGKASIASTHQMKPVDNENEIGLCCIWVMGVAGLGKIRPVEGKHP
jgi:hypothetical protein